MSTMYENIAKNFINEKPENKLTEKYWNNLFQFYNLLECKDECKGGQYYDSCDTCLAIKLINKNMIFGNIDMSFLIGTPSEKDLSILECYSSNLVELYEKHYSMFEVARADIDRGDFQCDSDDEEEDIRLDIKHLSNSELKDLLQEYSEEKEENGFMTLVGNSIKIQNEINRQREMYSLFSKNENKTRVYLLNREIQNRLTKKHDLINVNLLDNKPNIPSVIVNHIASFL